MTLASLPTAARARSDVARVDVSRLERALRERVRGEVRFDSASRALYARDASNYRMPPIGVVVPLDVDDVVEAVAVCREFGAPVLTRGGGTSLAGECCNVAVVLDFSKHVRRILEIDPEARTALVEPGVVLDTLRDAAGEHGLTFGPDPATHNRCTLGGMIGNNSCGMHAQMAGCVANNVIALEVLTYDGMRCWVGETSPEKLASIIAQGNRRGEIYRDLAALAKEHEDEIRSGFPDIPRRISGYNLPDLLRERGFNVARALTGSEGTLVVVLRAKLRLVPWPSKRALVLLSYDDVYKAGADVERVLSGSSPIALEGMDGKLVEYAKKKNLEPEGVAKLPEGGGWLFLEFGGDTQDELEEEVQRLMRHLEQRDDAPKQKTFWDPDEQALLWAVRESGLGATARVPDEPDTWPGWEDSAVPIAQVGYYLGELRKLFDKYGYDAALYGHFGQGCIHTRIPFDLRSKEGIAAYRAFVEEAADLVHSLGGSFSGEHGDGQARGELLPRMFSPQLMDAMRTFKRIWDPLNRMNPGRVIDAYPLDENLVLGADYKAWEPKTHFSFHTDDGSLSRATLRCVGVGLCRRDDAGTMCPSYMVLREEMHSTRGRAHLLHEMLQGDIVTDGWKDEGVHESLDLCLSCKGCKGDCPVNVDIATYKAEFMSHYYEGRLRPRHAYAFGLIDKWLALGSLAPRLANLPTRTPGLVDIARKIADIARQRTIPPIAEKTFLRAHKPSPRAAGAVAPHGRVLLWADTFNNHIYPDVLHAAAEALDALGFEVAVPKRRLCCGRPLYEYGMLDRAKRYLRDVMDELRDEIRAGTPIVGVEPSCVSVFRDELPNLFPDDEDARRLADQTMMLGELLADRANDLDLPRLERRALVHGHCHQKAVLEFDKDLDVLERMGVECDVPDAGCCGMAGAFGFTRGKYDIAIGAGERVLLPKVRETPDDTLIITDGFSCREQIRQSGGRDSLNLSQVLRMALRR